MRRTHHFTTQLDYDELRPRITQYQVSKHLVREDPWDTKSQLTGDVHYCIHTAFVDALGIRGHRNIANTNPEVYARMTPFFLKHGIHADVTDHVVVANMQRPNFVSNIIRGVGKLFTKTEQDVALQELKRSSTARGCDAVMIRGMSSTVLEGAFLLLISAPAVG